VRIRAGSLDLDDTLWPIEPVMLRAEQRLDAWLKHHCPEVAAKFPILQMRALRERISAEHPHLSHDFTAQRMLSLRAALLPHGYTDRHVDDAFAEYYAARNDVELYADAAPALERMAARFPLVSISNGNADLVRIGLASLFKHSISSREFGVAKPAVGIFHAAAQLLEIPADEILHVGDDPELDVAGARAAGMRSAWLNRTEAVWPQGPAADIVVRDLRELADWLDTLPVNQAASAALA
jgi:HAD superfamily hydrolase (TIGR01549 family)